VVPSPHTFRTELTTYVAVWVGVILTVKGVWFAVAVVPSERVNVQGLSPVKLRVREAVSPKLTVELPPKVAVGRARIVKDGLLIDEAAALATTRKRYPVPAPTLVGILTVMGLRAPEAKARGVAKLPVTSESCTVYVTGLVNVPVTKKGRLRLVPTQTPPKATSATLILGTIETVAVPETIPAPQALLTDTKL